MTVIYRSAAEKDIDAIMRIEHESFVPGLREERELYLKRIRTFPEGFLVAEDDGTGEVGGYISSEIWHRDQPVGAETLALGHDPEEVHNPEGTHFYITSFGMLASWRGKGIGAALFEELERRIAARSPAVEKSILIVSEKWLTAHHIYEKHGFKEVGRIIDFFLPEETPPEDAVIMMK